MKTTTTIFTNLILAIGFVSCSPFQVAAQSIQPAVRITQPVDAAKLTALVGNTHPLARAEYDRGPAPSSLAMDHMQLVLTRSAQQEAALQALEAQQQDPSSPNYHKWLTPDEFGQQFGAADADVQTITAWLQSNGFQIDSVAKGKNIIQFSGNAGQVQVAFHTAIHKYVLASGEEHWANSADPQIPAALGAVIKGVTSLNDFRRKPLHHTLGAVQKSTATGKFTRINSEFTFGPLANGCTGANTNCYGIGPGDFATIYNLPPTVNGVTPGTGQTIAIVSDSDIFATDVSAFRTIFGLPAITFNQIETGTDPGVEFTNANQDEEEAVLDVEWSGAVAPGATIDLVVSPSTNAAFGGDTSALYVIDGNISPLPQVLSYSYGACELALGTAGNQFYSTEWQQAAAEGITVVVATGDNGSAGCDIDQVNGPSSQPAEEGLEINGVASTPYNVAVGGTDFNDLNNPGTYFSNVAGTLSSAKSYIPETAYNDTCTNPVIVAALGLASAEVACNNVSVQDDGFVTASGGGGGVSNCTTPNGPGPSNCLGGYPKPPWQSAVGVPADGLRDVPDVSLFAGDGTIQNFYVICESDLAGLSSSIPPPPCGLGTPYEDFVGEGGTSVSVQAFAGLVALMAQKQGASLGNINPLLYSLAGESSASSIFNDVTLGTNAMPCIVETGVTGCNVGTGFTVGLLSGYNAGTGFDLATGLGSVNAANLVNSAGPNFYLSATNPTITVPSPGMSGSTTITVSSINGFSGVVNFACTGLPSEAGCSFNPTSVTVAAGTVAAPGTGSTMLTVTTKATGSVIVAVRPWRDDLWNIGGKIASLLFILAIGLSFTLRKEQRKWSTVPAFAAFGLLLVVAACGGSSSSTTGSSPTNPAPVVGVSPSSLMFASQNVGTTSASQAVTLSNTGTAALSISSITASAQFAESSNCGTSVAAAGSCAINVTFDPTAAGTQAGTLTIVDNATGSPHTVALTGTAVTSGGAGNLGTPTGTTQITVTATSGTVSFPMKVTLAVQ